MEIRDIIKLGDHRYSHQIFYEALEYYIKALHSVNYQDNLLLHIDIRLKVARTYYRQSNYFEAIRHLDILEAITKDESLVRVITFKSICYSSIGYFDEALKCLERLKSVNSQLANRKFLFTQGTIYLRVGQYIDSTAISQAIESFLKAQNINDDAQVLHKIFRNLGICYNALGNYLKSLDYFNQALELTDSSHSISYTYHEMANSYGKLQDYSKAIELLEYCLKVAKNNQDLYGLGYTFMNFGEISFLQKDLHQGEDFTNQAIDNFFTTHNYPELSSCYKQLHQYMLDANPEKAKVYQREYLRYKSKIAV